MDFTPQQLLSIKQAELERIKKYFDRPKKETIQRLEDEIKNLQNDSSDKAIIG